MGRPKRKRCRKEDYVENEQNLEIASRKSALAQNHILERIIDYAIREKDGLTLCGKNVQNVRLVSKSWNERLAYVLQMSGEPLFILTLKNDDSEKQICKFKKVIALQNDNPFFWIRVFAYGTFFDPKNTYCLKPFIHQYAERLIQLHMCVPLDMCGKLIHHFGKWLPKLRGLSLYVNEHWNSSWDSSSEDDLVRMRKLNYDKLRRWLQHQLFERETLKQLCFGNRHPKLSVPPPPMPSLESLTRLRLHVQLNEDEVESLTAMSFPNLTELVLNFSPQVWPTKGPPGLLNRVLENCKNTLRKLTVQGEMPRVYIKNGVQAVSFPVMKELEELGTSSMEWELESNIRDLDYILPKLKRLFLYKQAPARLMKWVSGTPATNLKHLSVGLVRDIPTKDNNRTMIAGIQKRYIQPIHWTFPNIHSLELCLTAQTTEGLKYIFAEMRQLTALMLVVMWHKLVEWPSWDSILTGMADLEIINEQSNNVEEPSIRNLTGLVQLSLVGYDKVKDDESLISDSTFDDALLKMPNLRKLKLKGSFKASDRSEKAWKREGRTFLYTPYS